ncbi:7TMR-DISM family protein [Endothiovibrio diazotrophicus]
MKRWWIACLLLLSLPAGAAPLLLDGQESVELAGHLELLADPDGRLGIGQVASGAAGPFRPLPGHFTDGFGPLRGAWLRFTLIGSQGTPSRWWLRVHPAYLGRVMLYRPTAEGGWSAASAGSEHPEGRPLPDRVALFALEVVPDTPRTFYLYVRHGAHLAAYPVLHSTASLYRTVAGEDLLFGLFYGIVLVLVVINGLYWWALRERIHLEFALYLLFRGAFVLVANGHLGQFLLVDQPEMVIRLQLLLLGLTIASLAPFFTGILDMDEVFPRLARLCQGLGLIAVAAALVMAFGGWRGLSGPVVSFAVFIGLAGLATALVQWHRGAPRGRLLVLVMVVFLSGAGPTLLGTLGWHVSMLGDLYGVQLTTGLTFILLHFTVVSQVVGIKRAKEESERAARRAAEAVERERAARRAQSDFIAMLFHELKTPLAVIDSAATVLEHLDDGRRNETARRYDAIHGAVERLNRLVEQSLSPERQGPASALPDGGGAGGRGELR